MNKSFVRCVALVAMSSMITLPGIASADKGGVPAQPALDKAQGGNKSHNNGPAYDPHPEHGRDRGLPDPEPN